MRPKRTCTTLPKDGPSRAGETHEEDIEQIIEKTAGKRWEIDFAAIPEGPFYRPIRLGDQKRVILNTEHPFYTRVYNATSNPDVKAALEVLLFVQAERELETKGELETFYKSERNKWSERLRNALEGLIPNDSVINLASSIAEQMHTLAEHETGVGLQ